MRGIRRLLKTRFHDDAVLLQACDWYRRLGLYREGFRLLDISDALKGRHAAGSRTGRRLLWAARFLNLLGASHFAVQLVRTLRISSVEDHRIAGNVFLSNDEFADALRHFEAMLAHPLFAGDYTGRLAKIAYADSLCGLGRFQEAMALAEKTAQASPEPLLRGIALQAQGEYLARAGKFREALRVLKVAARHFPEGDETFDFAVLLKWQGDCHAKLGKTRQGKSELARAFMLMKTPGARAETWLGVLRLQEELGFISSSDGQSLRHYPAFSQRGPRGRRAFGSSNAFLKIDLDRDEYSEAPKRYLGIPLELRCLALLALSMPWGIEAERLKALLWPESLWSYEQLDRRLEQLLWRVRTRYGMEVLVQAGALSLAQRSLKRIQVWDGGGRLPPSFLAECSEERKLFTGGDLGDFYELSRTARSLYLDEWARSGWIQRSGKSPRFQYIVNC